LLAFKSKNEDKKLNVLFFRERQGKDNISTLSNALKQIIVDETM
jgi:hypothetical protein